MLFTVWILCAAAFSGVGCQSVQRDYARAHPPLPSSLIDLEGRWIDLEKAVSVAASDVGMAVTGKDRWHRAILFTLRTDTDQPASLLVGGRRAPTENLSPVDDGTDIGGSDSTGMSGVEWGEARVGRFGNPEREAALLVALRGRLAELADEPRHPRSD